MIVTTVFLVKYPFKKLLCMSHFTLKGQSHEISDPRFFSANNTPGAPDSWAKAVLNINSYSQRYSIFKFDSVLCRLAQSRFLVSDIQIFFL
jgi:hypothetical protein